MKNRQNLFRVIMIIISFFLGNFSLTLNPLKAEENITLDEELKLMNIIEDFDYRYNEFANEDTNVLLFLENKDLYNIYFYNPKGLENVKVNQIQIGLINSNVKDTLNDDSNLKVNYYDLEFISITENKCVQKYRIINIDENVHLYNYRRYSLRQIQYKDEIWQTLGDEYFYYEENGSTKYEYKKATYITLKNVATYNVYIENDDIWNSIIRVDKGKDVYFYGFSTDFKIDSLKEIEILYDYQKFNGYRGNEYVDIYNPNYDVDDFSKQFLPKIDEKQQMDVIITHKKEDIILDGGLFCKSSTIKWDTISTYNEMMNISNESLKNKISMNFKNCDYIVNYASFDFEFAKRNVIYVPGDPYYDFIKYLDNNGISSSNGFYNVIRVDNGTLVTNVNMIRMKYETNGTIYDVQVIVAPQDSTSMGKLESDSLLSQIKEILKIVLMIITIYFLIKFVVFIIDSFKKVIR